MRGAFLLKTRTFLSLGTIRLACNLEKSINNGNYINTGSSCVSMSKKNNNQENYVTLKVPKALADEIDRLIKAGTLGYRSRAEMVNDFIRRGIEQLKNLNEK